MASPRVARVSGRIQQIVASMVTTRLKDPRLSLVTITDVRVTGDLQHAQIFYTVYGDEKKMRDAGKALEKASGMIRSAVGRELGLRLTPTLEFIADALPESARSFEDALVAARFRDEQIARQAEGATPAGEADPYKSSAEGEEQADAHVAANAAEGDEGFITVFDADADASDAPQE